MHPLVKAVLTLLLLVTHAAQAQAPLPPGFVDAGAVVDGLVVDMRYFGDKNFVGERIDGYERARCVLSAPAASALVTVQRDLAARGLGLKVFDCYRPQRAVAHFVRWAQRIDDVKRKREFYPDVDKRDLFKEGYIAERSGHSRGSTVDLTLAARGRTRARYGLAVRLLQPEILALGHDRGRAGASEPCTARRGDDARRLSALRQGMVALHARR
ncbi:MAG TPA: M15 family metallopeptidase [Xanthobacteraceae bacterium]